MEAQVELEEHTKNYNPHKLLNSAFISASLQICYLKIRTGQHNLKLQFVILGIQIEHLLPSLSCFCTAPRLLQPISQFSEERRN